MPSFEKYDSELFQTLILVENIKENFQPIFNP